MRTERDQHTESNGCKGSNHWSGSFAEAVDNPCEGAATAVPEARDDDAEDGHAAFAIARQAAARDTRDQETDRNQQGWNRAYQADPMKAARQTIQLPLPLLGTATTCPLACSTARGDALLMLASFTMVTWVMMRGLA
jgi:hypothetical protein